MDLGDVYQKNVKKTQIVGGLSHGLPNIERDPTILNLENNVFAQMRSILPKEPEPVLDKTDNVKFVSLEDALKELSEFIKK